MKNKISAGTIARTIILVLALVNQCLSMAGFPILPIADEQIETLVTTMWTVVASLLTWWKNSSFTSHAIQADNVMAALKQNNNVEVTVNGERI